jgi:hypothetical protein
VSTPGAAARASDPPADEPRLTVVRLDEPLAPSPGAPPTAGTPRRPPSPGPPQAGAPRRVRAPRCAGGAPMHRRRRAVDRRRCALQSASHWLRRPRTGRASSHSTANTDAIRHEVDSAARASVADALRRLGLGYTARKLLGPVETNEAPGAPYRAGRARRARRRHRRCDLDARRPRRCNGRPGARPEARRLRTRLALAAATWRPRRRASAIAPPPSCAPRSPHAALESGRAAMDKRVCRQARRVPPGARRRRRAHRPHRRGRRPRARCSSCRDVEATMQGLGVLAESPHPLLAPRRVRDRGDADGRGPRDGDPARSKRGG